MGIPPEMTLSCLLKTCVEHYGDRPSFGNLGKEHMTFSEFEGAVSTLSDWLSDQGVGFGDKVCIIADNSPQWGIAYYAITIMGAVAVPVLTEFHPEAMAHIIRHSEAKMVFVSERIFPKVEDANYENAPVFVDIDTYAFLEQGSSSARMQELKTAGMREFRRWKEKAVRFAKCSPRKVAENDLAAIVYTSGTTGHSKGVQLTHSNLVCNALSVIDVFPILSTDRFLSILPLPHTYECTLGLVVPVLCGSQVTYLGKPPTARVLLPALKEVKPTIMLTVPLVMEKIYKNSILPKLTSSWLHRQLLAIPFTRKLLVRAAGKKLLAVFGGALRAYAISGAPIASDVEKFLYESEFPYVIGYGMTESSPLISGITVFKQRLGTTGTAVLGVKVRIGNPDPETGIGEVQATGNNIMTGYFKLPELNSEVFTEDGWLRTGDLGSLDADGFLSIRGRLKNMILGPSGENIYPEEIESFFFEFPYVSDVMVYMSEGRVTARVHLDPDYVETNFGKLSPAEQEKGIRTLLEEARKTVNGKVSSFSRIGKIIQQIEPFEKTATQKIKRYLYTESNS